MGMTKRAGEGGLEDFQPRFHGLQAVIRVEGPGHIDGNPSTRLGPEAGVLRQNTLGNEFRIRTNNRFEHWSLNPQGTRYRRQNLDSNQHGPLGLGAVPDSCEGEPWGVGTEYGVVPPKFARHSWTIWGIAWSVDGKFGID